MPSPGPVTTTTSATSLRACPRCQVQQVMEVDYLEVLADHDARGVPDGGAAEGEEEPVGEEDLGARGAGQTGACRRGFVRQDLTCRL